MKNVKLDNFKKPVIHKNVKQIVFRGEKEGKDFDLGFLPEGEFIYHFSVSPDVYFLNLDIEEVYYEPYRTFLRLKKPTDLEIVWFDDKEDIKTGPPGKGYDKLYIRGIK